MDLYTKCGYENKLSEDDIHESEEAYEKSQKEKDEEDYDDGFGYDREWEFCTPRRCECCNRLLNLQSSFSEGSDYHTCEKCGYYNDFSSSNEDDDEEDNEEDDEEDDDEDEYDRYDEDEDDNDNEDDEEDDSNDHVLNVDHHDAVSNERVEHLRALALEESLRKQREIMQKQQLREAEARIRREKRKARLTKVWRTLSGKKQIVGLSSDQCKTMNYTEVVKILQGKEFYNVTTRAIEDLSPEDKARAGIVERVSFNGQETFTASSAFPYASRIEIIYHVLKRRNPPLTAREAKRMDIDDVVWEFTNAGFENIEKIPIADLKTGWLNREDSVESVTIDGKSGFKKSDRINVAAHIIIRYHVFKNKA